VRIGSRLAACGTKVVRALLLLDAVARPGTSICIRRGRFGKVGGRYSRCDYRVRVTT
jgi:hypothetical protein